MLKKENAFIVFFTSWIIFLLYNTVEWNLPFSYNLDLIPFIYVTANPLIKFLPVVFFAIIVFPKKEILRMLQDRKILFLLGLILLLITTGYISAVMSDNIGRSVSFCNRYLYFYFVFIVCMLGVRYFEGMRDIYLRTFIYVNVLIILISLLDFYIPDVHYFLIKYFNRPEVIHSFIKIGDVKVMRPMGILTDSNLTAFSIGTALLLMLFNNNKFHRVLRYLFYIGGSYIFGMLISRASLIMCLVLIIVFYILRKDGRKEVIIFSILFIVFQLITPQTYARVTSVFDKSKIEEEFSVGRPVIWQAAINVHKSNKIIGVGPGIFFEMSDVYIREILKERGDLNIDNPAGDNYHQIDKLNPHNIFLVMLTETGFVGLAMFLILTGYIVMGLIKQRRFTVLWFFLGILFVSSLSNFAPYYKFYFIVCIVVYMVSTTEERLNQNYIRHKQLITSD
jgi:O-antigen ligase